MQQPELIVRFASQITAASQEGRTITGQIVPFGQVGATSVGPVIFEAGSLSIDSAAVKLLLQHDGTRPIGRMESFQVTDAGINATFKVAQTSAGTDSLVEASQGLRDGLSVGASITDSIQKKDGLHVLSANLIEVSLVTDPAFDSARVAQVAASADTEPESIEEIDMSENTAAPEAEVVEEVAAPVEASRTVTASAPVFTTAPRSPIVNAASYLEHSILAAQGHADSAQYVSAANDSTSTNTGLTLPEHMGEFITSTFGGRPAVDACSRGTLPASGLSFTIPVLGTAPTAAAATEAGTFSNTGMTSTYQTVTISKYAAQNTVSFELLDRSNPAFYDALISEMGKAYAKATDNAVIAAFVSGGTTATVTTGDAAGLQSFIAVEGAAAFKGTSEYASNLVASTDQWAAIMGYADTTGRPLYNASNPQNNNGQAGIGSITGSVLGTNLYVDPNITVSGLIDNSAYLIVPGAVTVYESPQVRLQVNVIGTGEVQVGLYGYMGIAVKKATGVRKFNVA
jgi:HK97 family phage major capsid protein